MRVVRYCVNFYSYDMAISEERRQYNREYHRQRRAEEKAARVEAGDVPKVGRPKKKPPVLRKSKRADFIRMALLETVAAYRNSRRAVLVPWHLIKQTTDMNMAHNAKRTQAQWLTAISQLVEKGVIPELEYSRRGWPKAIRIPAERKR